MDGSYLITTAEIDEELENDISSYMDNNTSYFLP